MQLRNFSIGLVLLLLAGGCGASSAPRDPVQLRGLLEHELVLLQTGLERQDALLASSPVDDAFTMDPNVAVRYLDKAFEGNGPSAFLAYTNKVFALHANISLSLTLIDLQQTDDLATATVHVVWNSQRTDTVPPGHYTADNMDYFFFRRHPAGWRLLNWKEIPAPAAPIP
jgi:hypothetical protein